VKTLKKSTKTIDPRMTSNISTAFDDFLKRCQQRVSHTLRLRLGQAGASTRLQEAMSYAALSNGKRVRPLLTYASALAVGGEIAYADPAACAVELIHCYSLVHDDLPAMDDDDLRRGQATVHKAYDEATAILVGDALQSMAFESLSEAQSGLAAASQLGMLRLLAEAAGPMGMVAGQFLDFEAVGTDLQLAQLETMHSLKTGALIKASVLLGGLSHVASSEQQLSALADYAANIGLAFQVQDDILDEIGDTQTLGKPGGSDRLLNKPTYVSLLGIEAARDRALQLSQQAIAALSDFSSSADLLRQLALYIVSRLH
jgi:geranylgeranyl diphosphate synthase type II